MNISITIGTRRINKELYDGRLSVIVNGEWQALYSFKVAGEECSNFTFYAKDKSERDVIERLLERAYDCVIKLEKDDIDIRSDFIDALKMSVESARIKHDG